MAQFLDWQSTVLFLLLSGLLLLRLRKIAGVHAYQEPNKKQSSKALNWNVLLVTFIIIASIWCILSVCDTSAWANLSRGFGADFLRSIPVICMANCHITTVNGSRDKNGAKQGKCKILHVVYGVNDGGVEATIYNYYEHMDKQKFQFDVLAQASAQADISKYMFAAMLKELGAKVCYIPPKSDGLLKAIMNCKKIIHSGGYDIVHIHMGKASLPYVISARLAGVKKIIVHNHIAHDTSGWSTKKSTIIMGAMLKYFKTYKFACSEDAAKDMWQEDQVYIMYNALDTLKYRQDIAKSGIIKNQLKLEDKTAICAVARFEKSKNHPFLLEIFKEYLELDKSARLVLIGTGSTVEQIEKQAVVMQIADRVLFLGARKDVPDLLQGMDAFVLPSSFEGFGIAYIEAQLAGLHTFAIDGAVSQSVKLGDGMVFIPKNATAKEWAQAIQEALKNTIDMETVFNSARESGLDITQQAKKLEEYYLNM